MYNQALKKIVRSAMLIIVAFVFFSGLFLFGFDKKEKVECLKWQEDAKQFSGYYLLPWQKAQCDRQEIEVDAPVSTSSPVLIK